MYDKETEDRRQFWKRMGINFVERYFYLVLFHAYLRDVIRESSKASTAESPVKIPTDVTFSKWHDDRPQLYQILGTREKGALSEFSWS